MNGAEDCWWQAVVDHKGVFSTYTLLTRVVNGSENNGLHQAFYLNILESVYCARGSAASIQMSRNMAGSSGATTTVRNHFTNYSADTVSVMCHTLCFAAAARLCIGHPLPLQGCTPSVSLCIPSTPFGRQNGAFKDTLWVLASSKSVRIVSFFSCSSSLLLTWK